MIPHNKPNLGSLEIQAAADVIISGQISQGTQVERFESLFAENHQLSPEHAVALSSGTAAIYVALLALGAKGKKVAIPCYSCAALRNAVCLANAEPILLDVDARSGNIDIEALNESRAQIAIIPHMYGIPCDIRKINKNIKIIEDCAQSLGAKLDTSRVGIVGDIGIFSFYATKIITSGGQGGMLISRNQKYSAFARDYRNFDCRRDEKPRFNLQMTDIQAAIGIEQFKRLTDFLQFREEVFQVYKSQGWRMLEPAPESDFHAVRYRAILFHPSAERLIKHLKARSISSIIPIEEWEIMGKREMFPNARFMSNNTVSLPIHTMLTEEDIEKIVIEVNRRI